VTGEAADMAGSFFTSERGLPGNGEFPGCAVTLSDLLFGRNFELLAGREATAAESVLPETENRN